MKDNMKLRKKTEEIKNRKYLQGNMTIGQNFQQELKKKRIIISHICTVAARQDSLCQTLYKYQDSFCLNSILTLLLLLNLILTSLFLIQYHQLLTLSHHMEVSKSNFALHLLCNTNFHIQFFLHRKPSFFHTFFSVFIMPSNLVMNFYKTNILHTFKFLLKPVTQLDILKNLMTQVIRVTKPMLCSDSHKKPCYIHALNKKNSCASSQKNNFCPATFRYARSDSRSSTFKCYSSMKNESLRVGFQ